PDGTTLAEREKMLFSGVKGLIREPNPIADDPEGDYQFYLYQQWVSGQISAARAKGQDPAFLFDPANPAFLGSPQALAPFQKSLSQSMQDQIGKIVTDRIMPGMDSPPPRTSYPIDSNFTKMLRQLGIVAPHTGGIQGNPEAKTDFDPRTFTQAD